VVNIHVQIRQVTDSRGDAGIVSQESRTNSARVGTRGRYRCYQRSLAESAAVGSAEHNQVVNTIRGIAIERVLARPQSTHRVTQHVHLPHAELSLEILDLACESYPSMHDRVISVL